MECKIDKKMLSKYTFIELKKMAKEMGIKSRRSSVEYINSILSELQEYEDYKKKKLDKYTRIRQLGERGKEGTTYLVRNPRDKEFAMKTFRKTKSSVTLKNEYELQKKAASQGVAPRVVEYDTVSKYIVMEKLGHHLFDDMKKQKGRLTRKQQEEILDIFEKLDKAGVFHGDSNIMNYMLKNGKIYLIDYGFSKEITPKLIKKLGTETPNSSIMTLGLILKLKELECQPSSWRYLKKKVSPENLQKFHL